MLSSFVPSSLIPSSSSSITPVNVKWLAEQVRQSRDDHAALEAAIADHEAQALAVKAPALAGGRSLRASGGRGGKGGGAMAPRSRADLRVRPPSRRIPSSVPKQVSNQVVWDIVRTDLTINVGTGGIAETNFSFSLASHPQAGSWGTLYDQWCIPQVTVMFRSEQPPGATFVPAIIYTALDFDGVGNLGSIAAIEDYSTCAQCTMSPGRTHTRSIKPCIKISTQQPSTNVNSSVDRLWQDVGANGTPWFGIRSIVSSSTATYPIVATTLTWYAFRNQI
jgi:hypothetical protein